MLRRKSKWDIQAAPSTQDNGIPKSATEDARERAAKLTAMLAAKGKLAKNTGAPLPRPVSQPMPVAQSFVPKVDKEQDVITAEVEINDSPSRTILCKGTTQDEINRYSGAAVSTKGRYMDAEEKRIADKDSERPLYLCIQAASQEKVELAIKRVHEIMRGADIHGKLPLEQATSQSRWSPYQSPASTSYATPNTVQPTQPTPSQMLPTGMHYVQDKVFVGLDHTAMSPDFNVKEKLLGPGGSYFQHISTETGAKVFLRGKGSGFLEPTSGREAFEALHIYISHTKAEGLSAARKLVENLIQTVNNEYQNVEQMKRAQQVGYSAQPGYPGGYVHPSYGYPPQPPGMYPTPPPGAAYYSHLPQAPIPAPPPGQLMPPHGYGPPSPAVAPYPNPPIPGVQPNGVPTAYPGQSSPVHYGAPSPAMLYPQMPNAPQDLLSATNIPMPPNLTNTQATPREHPTQDKDLQDKNNRENIQIPPPEPIRRRFKEVPRSESTLGLQQRITFIQESPKVKDTYLGSTRETTSSTQDLKEKEDNVMPPPPSILPRCLMAPPKPMATTSLIRKDFKKPLGSAKPFVVPPPPKDIIDKKQSTAPKANLSGTRKHSLLPVTDNLESKKLKTDGNAALLLAIASLVAYGDEDSSDEEEELQQVISRRNQQNDSKSNTRNQKQNLPFWAVGK